MAAITGNVQIGFDAGDQIRASVVFEYESTESDLEEVNIFRTDGKSVQWCGEIIYTPYLCTRPVTTKSVLSICGSNLYVFKPQRPPPPTFRFVHLKLLSIFITLQV